MRASLLAVAVLAAGCTPDLCSRNSDCVTGQVCSMAGQCSLPADSGIDARPDLGSPTTVGAPRGSDDPAPP